MGRERKPTGLNPDLYLLIPIGCAGFVAAFIAVGAPAHWIEWTLLAAVLACGLSLLTTLGYLFSRVKLRRALSRGRTRPDALVRTSGRASRRWFLAWQLLVVTACLAGATLCLHLLGTASIGIAVTGFCLALGLLHLAGLGRRGPIVPAAATGLVPAEGSGLAPLIWHRRVTNSVATDVLLSQSGQRTALVQQLYGAAHDAAAQIPDLRNRPSETARSEVAARRSAVVRTVLPFGLLAIVATLAYMVVRPAEIWVPPKPLDLAGQLQDQIVAALADPEPETADPSAERPPLETAQPPPTDADQPVDVAALPGQSASDTDPPTLGDTAPTGRDPSSEATPGADDSAAGNTAQQAGGQGEGEADNPQDTTTPNPGEPSANNPSDQPGGSTANPSQDGGPSQQPDQSPQTGVGTPSKAPDAEPGNGANPSQDSHPSQQSEPSSPAGNGTPTQTPGAGTADPGSAPPDQTNQNPDQSPPSANATPSANGQTPPGESQNPTDQTQQQAGQQQDSPPSGANAQNDSQSARNSPADNQTQDAPPPKDGQPSDQSGQGDGGESPPDSAAQGQQDGASQGQQDSASQGQQDSPAQGQQPGAADGKPGEGEAAGKGTPGNPQQGNSAKADAGNAGQGSPAQDEPTEGESPGQPGAAGLGDVDRQNGSAENAPSNGVKIEVVPSEENGGPAIGLAPAPDAPEGAAAGSPPEEKVDLLDLPPTDIEAAAQDTLFAPAGEAPPAANLRIGPNAEPEAGGAVHKPQQQLPDWIRELSGHSDD